MEFHSQGLYHKHYELVTEEEKGYIEVILRVGIRMKNRRTESTVRFFKTIEIEILFVSFFAHFQQFLIC